MSNKYPGGIISLGGPESNSNAFNGSSQYLSASSATAFAMGTGDFTVEAWVYMSAYTDACMFGTVNGSTSGYYVNLGSNINSLRVTSNASGSWADTITVASGNGVPLGVWTHIALSRSGANLVLYKNGISVASTASASAYNFTSPSNAGYVGYVTNGSSTQYFSGFISNLRVIKGTAVYTANFVPPTGPLQNISNTSLLTCQSPTIIDNSSNGFTITNTGGVTINASTPFTAYNPNTLNPALGSATPGVWNLDQALNAEVTRAWPMYDPYYNNVVLNLHGNGNTLPAVTGSQNNTFIDSSSNAFSITRNGNTTQGSYSPYGSLWSNYFNGASTLAAPANAAFTFGTGDFTVEGWLFSATANSTANGIFQQGTSFPQNNTTNTVAFGTVNSGQTWQIYAKNTSTASTATWSLNTWYHFALVRNSGTTVLYINGTAVITLTSDTTNYTGTYFGVGQIYSGIGNHEGYISNVRVVNGTAVYTSAFNPPTTFLTAISGTSFLTCQSNRFIDNSTANSGSGFPITVSGSPSVQRFSPFLPNLPYESSRLGGSGYFDGGGDSLQTTTNIAALGTGDFTVEGWYYPTASSSFKYLFSIGSDSNLSIVLDNNTYTPYFYAGGVILSSSKSLIGNQWNHVVFVRSGTTLTAYINGESGGSASFSASVAAGIGYVSQQSSGSYVYTGYQSNVRVVAAAVYTGAFTPPTLAPLGTTCANSVASYSSTTNVNTSSTTGASLLLNMTNAGIFDNAAMNDLETVGGAAVSTVQSKYGGASMYFDYSASYLTSPFVAPQNLGTGDFTIEMWAYWSSLASTTGLFNKSYTTDGNTWQGMHAFVSTAGTINFETNDTLSSGSTGARISSSSNVSTGTWYHIAFVRSAGTTTIYLNGVSVGSGSNSGSCDNTYGFVVAKARPNTTWYMNGYLDDFRATKGVARYTATFTPPTSQLQDQ